MRMYHVWSKALTASFVLALPVAAAAQTAFWEPTNIPYGGRITALVSDLDGNILAGTKRGIYRTTNLGDLWTRVSSSITPEREAFRVDTAGNILAGTWEGIWKSTDGGTTWENAGLPDYAVRSLLTYSEGNILAGLSYVTGNPSKGPGGVFRSTDGGTTWELFGLQGRSINDLLLSPTHGLVALDGNRVFVGNVTDTNWAQIASIGGHSLCEDVSGNLFMGREVDGVRISTDGGATWNQTNLQSPYTIVALASLPTGEIFAGAVPLDPSIPGGAFRTTDAGQTWSSLGMEESPIYALLALDADRLYLGASRGVYRSTDAAATWSEANEGIAATEIGPILCLDSSTVLIGTTSGLFRSTDNGQSWIGSSEGNPYSATCLAMDHSMNVFAGNAVFSPKGGIFKSTDMGLTWRCTSQDSIKGLYISINGLGVTSGNTTLAGVDGQGRIYRSTDEGENWSRIRNGGKTVEGFAVDSAGQIYGATWGEGVLRSTDDGLTWDLVNTGLLNLNISCLATRAPDEVFSAAFWGVARSTNAGDLWTDISAGLGGAVVVALAVDARGDLLASTLDDGVFRTTDDGLTWLPDTIGLGGLTVYAFSSSGGPLFATDSVNLYRSTDVVVPIQLSSLTVSADASGAIVQWTTLTETNNFGFFVQRRSEDVQEFSDLASSFTPGHGTTSVPHTYSYMDTTATPGVWLYRLRQVDLNGTSHFSEPVRLEITTEVEETNPVSFTLEQNYPNPFNPTTTIRYGLPQRSAVQLTVLNALGQEVAVLLEAEQEAGYHEVKFDAGGLSSAVYFYRLRAGNLILTRKLLLLR